MPENIYNNVTENEEEEYRIFEFFKTNPELLTGMGSVLLIILSAVLSFCSYISERAIARYWGVDPVYINSSSSVKLYGTVISFVFLFVLFLIFGAFVAVAATSKPIRRIKKYTRYLRRFNRWQKLCSRAGGQQSGYNPAAEAQIRELTGNIRRKTRNRNRQVWVHFAVFELFLTPVMIIWSHAGSVTIFPTWDDTLIVTALFSVGIIFLLFLLANFSVRGSRIDKKMARQQYEHAQIHTGVPDVVLPLRVLFSGDYALNLRLSDRDVKELLWKGVAFILAVIIGFTLIFSAIGYNAASSQKEFWITDCEGEKYAVVYNNGEIAVLARAEAETSEFGWKELSIYTYQQKIVSVDTLTYESEYFDSVYGVEVDMQELWIEATEYETVYE